MASRLLRASGRFASSAVAPARSAVAAASSLRVVAAPAAAFPAPALSAFGGFASFATAAAPKKPAFAKVGTAAGKAMPIKTAPPVTVAAAVARPELSKVMRLLLMKIHPDHMAAYPAQQQANETSLAMLQGFLTALKDPSGDAEMPRLINEQLVFYTRTETVGHFRQITLSLHVPGGKCAPVVHKQLLAFFKQLGLCEDFAWDKEYFPIKFQKTPKAKEEEQAEQEAGGPHANESYEEFSARMQREAEAKQQYA